MLGVTGDGLASHPGGIVIILVASCYGNWDKLQLFEPLGEGKKEGEKKRVINN